MGGPFPTIRTFFRLSVWRAIHSNKVSKKFSISYGDQKTTNLEINPAAMPSH
jgi:hypothetical protein